MINLDKGNKDCVLVAIDIAKKSHDAAIQFPKGKRVTMKFTNTLAGYQLLLDRCKAVNASWCHHFPVPEQEKCFTTPGIKITENMQKSFSI